MYTRTLSIFAQQLNWKKEKIHKYIYIYIVVNTGIRDKCKVTIRMCYDRSNVYGCFSADNVTKSSSNIAWLQQPPN